MRILMLTSSYPKYPGETTAPFIEEIAASLAARGHCIHVVAPWHPDVQRTPSDRGVHLHFFRYAPHSSLNIWGYAQSLVSDTDIKPQTLLALPFALAGTVRAMNKMLRCRNGNTNSDGPALPDHFDLIHAHWVLPNGVPAAITSRWHHLPLIISLHGSDIYLAERHWILAASAGIALREAAAVTACSTDLRRRSIILGTRVDDSHVIPYGINPHEFRPDPDAQRLVRAELALHKDAPLVIALGRLVSKKGFEVLLEAWPQVLAQHPQAFLAIVGYGDLRTKLEQQANRLGIMANVRFTGQLERQRAAAYLAAADVFALPIVRDQGSDGLPNVLLEAMGAGRPIVASRVAGVPDVIENNHHGLLVPERDPGALTAAIIHLIEDRATAQRLGQAARQRIETDLTWSQTAARFEQVYQDVICAKSLA